MNDKSVNRLDDATSARLGRLAARPVDTSLLAERLDAFVRDQVSEEPHKTLPLQRKTWSRPIWAAAMILLTVTLGGVLLMDTNTPAMAGPIDFARMYEQVMIEMPEHMKVTSVEQANEILAAQASGAISVPQMPGQMHACCLYQHKGATLTFVAIEHEDKLITIALADGNKLQSVEGQTITRNGRSFFTHTVEQINMVMANENNRMMCVMGPVPVDQLLEVAQAIQM